jgi:hypothetical protein
MHGAGRAKLGRDTPREWFEQLPAGDPHKVRERKPEPRDQPRQKTRRRQLNLPLDV